MKTLEVWYSTEVAVCIQEKDTRCELDPDTWRELATLVYLSNANRAKDGLLSSKLLMKQRRRLYLQTD